MSTAFKKFGISNCCMLLAFCLALLAIQPYFNKDAVDPSNARVTATGEVSPRIKPATVTILLGEVFNRSSTPFEFVLTNVGSRPLKVVGTPTYCGKTGCIGAINPPEIIEASQSVTFHYMCQSDVAGSIEFATEIYLDAGGGVGLKVPINVIGSVAQPEH